MTAPDPGRTAYEARFADAIPRGFDPWDSLEPDEKAIWTRVEAACVAPIKADLAAAVIQVGEQARLRGEAEGKMLAAEMPGILDGWMDRANAAEAEASKLRETVAKLKEENDRLLIAFHDAIRRPLGVTPDSGAEFYDPRMADEAEARRASRVVLRDLDPEEAAARAAALADARRREERGGGKP